MTMRVTMLNARRGEGVDLIAGQTYTVSDALGAQLVGAGHATDTDKALTPVGSEPVRGGVNPLTGGIVKTIANLTQAQYDALAVKDPEVLYVIVG